MSCTSEETRSTLQHVIGRQAEELTANLECLRTGTCSLNAPEISGCHVAGMRTRRQADLGAVRVSVSMTYHAKSVASPYGTRRQYLY